MDKLLQRDSIVKLLAVLIAVIMWFQVTGDQNQTSISSNYAVEIEYRNKPTGVFEGDLPKTARVYLQGSNRALSRVSLSQIRAWVDLAGVLPNSPTALNVNVTVDAPGVQVWSITPNSVTVRLEQESAEPRPIEPQYLGTIPDEVRIDEVTFAVSEAKVWGPASRVNQVTRVAAMIDPTVLLTKAGTEPIEVVLQPVNAQGKQIDGVRLDPLTTKASIRWTRTPSKELPVRPNLTGRPAPGMLLGTVTVMPERVRVKAPPV